jgi:hypothetical protein
MTFETLSLSTTRSLPPTTLPPICIHIAPSLSQHTQTIAATAGLLINQYRSSLRITPRLY